MVEDLLKAALDAARGTGVRYAEVRLYSDYRHEYLAIKNGQTEVLTSRDDRGLGVRVLRPKGWGFGATSVLTREAVREAALRADRMARSAEATGSEIPWTEEAHLPHQGHYASSVREDPFEVPLEEKVALLSDVVRGLQVGPAVKVGRAELSAWKEEKHFLSSEGASYVSQITHVGAGMVAMALEGGEMQLRSYPTSFGGDFAQGGFEHIRSWDLPGHAAETGHTAVALVTAPVAPSGVMNLVLASDQLALQVHESVGHATELDRVLGYEAGYAGTSFVRTQDRGSLRYGSPRMTIVADATVPGALGTFGWDDEGTPAQRVEIVKEGIHTGFLSSRETAARINLPRSGGAMRGEGPLRTPLIRMTNVNLLPGDHSPEELIREAKKGIYLETNVSWSIDDKRLNFQFGCEVGRVIENGELGPLVRNPLYSGMTPVFWNSLRATSNPATWHVWGIPNCGKGQPGQAMHVGHGAPMGLFENVRVGGGTL